MVRRGVALATRLSALGLACLVGVAACSSAGSGAPANGTTPATGSPATAAAAHLKPAAGVVPADARTALGDLRTLESCSLVDLKAFQPLGPASFGDPQSLDYCVVYVETSAGTVELHLGEVVDTASTATATQPSGQPSAQPNGQPSAPAERGTDQLAGGARVVAGGQGPSSCRDQVDFNDGIGLQSLALPPYGTSVVGTCAVADAGLTGALTALAGGQVTHRSYPARSFGPVDACAILGSAAVGPVLPDLATATAVTHPARHQCEFGTVGPTTTYAALVLGAAYQRFDGGPTSTTLTVGHHQVVLIPTQPTGRPTECTGYGPHVPFPSRSGQPAMEMAELHVSLPDDAPAAQACRDVAALARVVFSRLP